jgi:hypothetical protein
MYQPGEMTFRTRIPYELLITSAAEAVDCHVLMETLAYIDDYDGVRRDVGTFNSRSGNVFSGQIVYPHKMEAGPHSRSTSLPPRTAIRPTRSVDEIMADFDAQFARRRAREPTTPAPAVPEVPEVSCDLTLCSDDDLWAELARRGLMVNGGEAILINTC